MNTDRSHHSSIIISIDSVACLSCLYIYKTISYGYHSESVFVPADIHT